MNIRNVGPVAATHWEFISEYLVGMPEARLRDIVADVGQFPHSRGGASGIPVGDRTLYPQGSARQRQVDLGIRVRPVPPDVLAVEAEINALFVPELALQFRVASLTDAGTTIERPLAPVLNREAVIENVLRVLGQK